MNLIKKILVCVDQSPKEANVYALAREAADVFSAKEVYLMTVTDTRAYAPMMQSQTKARIKSTVKQKKEHLYEIEKEYFGDYDKGQVTCKSITGIPLYQILDFACDEEMDLILLGRGYGEEFEKGDKALLARRITRKATCSVLTVPDGSNGGIKKLLVPVRNSECSANALSMACNWGSLASAEVIPLNIFPVHGGYSKIGSTLEEHRDILEEAANIECDELLKKVDAGSVAMHPLCIPDHHGTPTAVVLETAKKMSADMVVIGARGRSGLAGILLGTVTEQLIRYSNLPILAVKKTGENVGILKALLTLAATEES